LLRFLKNKQSYEKLSDKDLIEIFRQRKDKDCIGILFSRYTHLVFGICMKYLKNQIDAEDATMEIFEDLFEKLILYQIENFNSWIYSVSKNKCLMILRSLKIRQEKKRNIYENYYLENVENNSEFHLLNKEDSFLKNKVESALLALKMEQQHCIRLMYTENRSYKEISNITGYSLKQVKSYIQNGKRKLKLLLEK